ncbi:MAG: hypothetical protein KUG78_04890 [Kangiellaceae bacterium]|nr:hypothetical protein [Kangiellaceae bacterium]
MSIRTSIPKFIGGLAVLSLVTSIEATTFIDPESQTSWLGQGVQSSSGLFKEACVKGEWVEFNNQSLTFNYQDNKSARQSLREVSGGVAASVNLGLFGGGVSVQMHTRLEENENTASVVFRLSYKSKQITLQNRSYTTLGKSLIGQKPKKIEADCGDEYIDHIQLGNELYFVSQMVFSSKEEYEKFITKIKVRVLFFTTTSSITEEFYRYAQSGRYSIKVLSPNPLPQTIYDIVGDDGEMSCFPGNVKSIGACVQSNALIMDYLLSPDGYKEWLLNDNNLGVNYLNSSNYEKTGHSEYAGVVAPDVSDLINLQTSFREVLTRQFALRNIIQAYAEVPARNQIEYHALLLDVNSNITLLESAMSNCKSNPIVNLCQTEMDYAMEQLIPISL